MTSRHWRAAALLAPAAIAMAALATPAATASASPSWQLTDQYTSNPVCYTTSGGTEPLEINLSGTWSTPLSFGASALPAGGSYIDTIYYFASSPYSVLGTGPFTITATPQDFAEAYAVTAIPAGLALNSTFTITFWVSDGTSTQTESVPVAIKSSCKRKY